MGEFRTIILPKYSFNTLDKSEISLWQDEKHNFNSILLLRRQTSDITRNGNMSILIAMHLDEYAILGADKRTIFKWGSSIVSSSDDSCKIVETGIGLIGGCGYIGLLDSVKNRIKASNITHTDQILDIISDERDRVRYTLPKVLLDEYKILEHTGWILTYLTPQNGSYKLRVLIFHPSMSDTELVLMRENTVFPLFPHDLNEDDYYRFLRLLESDFKDTLSVPEFECNISCNSQLILRTINEVSKSCSSVSSNCDIFITTNLGIVKSILDISFSV